MSTGNIDPECRQPAKQCLYPLRDCAAMRVANIFIWIILPSFQRFTNHQQIEVNDSVKTYRHRLRGNNCFTSDFTDTCQGQENGETWESRGPLQDLEESILPLFTKLDASFFFLVVSGSNLDFLTISSPPILLAQQDLGLLWLLYLTLCAILVFAHLQLSLLPVHLLAPLGPLHIHLVSLCDSPDLT